MSARNEHVHPLFANIVNAMSAIAITDADRAAIKQIEAEAMAGMLAERKAAVAEACETLGVDAPKGEN